MIEVGDLVLRPWRAEDVSTVFQACQDTEIQRWTAVPRPYTARDAVAFVVGRAQPQPGPAGAHLAVVLLETGEVLGSVSVTGLGAGDGRVRCWLDPFARGRGFGATAVAGLTEWSFGDLDLERVRFRVARGNVAAQRLAARAGFGLDRVEPGAGCDGGGRVDALVYVRRRSRQA